MKKVFVSVYALLFLLLPGGCAAAQDRPLDARPPVSMDALKLPKIKPLTGGVSAEAYGVTDDLGAVDAQVKAHPEDPEAWFLVAVAYSRTPYAERAIVALDKARRVAKKHPEGYAIFDRKIAEYERMHAKTPPGSPEEARLLYRLGFGYYMRGYGVQYGYIKDTPPLSKQPLVLNGDTLAANTENQPAARPASWYYDKAEATFRRLLAIDPNDYNAMNYLGFLLVERNPDAPSGAEANHAAKTSHDAAIALWRKSLQIAPENPGALMLLGQSALHNGNLRAAVDYSARALKSRNAWLEAHNINPDTLKIHL